MASPDEIARIINATASGSSLIELDARGEIEAMLLREATMEDDLLRAERTCLAHSEPKKCLDVLVRHTSALLAETQRRVRVQKEWEAALIISSAVKRAGRYRRDLLSKRKGQRRATLAEQLVMGRQLNAGRAVLQKELHWLEEQRAMLRTEAGGVYERSRLPTKMKISQLKNRLAKSSGRGNKSQVVSAQMEMISLQKRLQRMEEMVETHFGAAARTLEGQALLQVDVWGTATIKRGISVLSKIERIAERGGVSNAPSAAPFAAPSDLPSEAGDDAGARKANEPKRPIDPHSWEGRERRRLAAINAPASAMKLAALLNGQAEQMRVRELSERLDQTREQLYRRANAVTNTAKQLPSVAFQPTAAPPTRRTAAAAAAAAAAVHAQPVSASRADDSKGAPRGAVWPKATLDEEGAAAVDAAREAARQAEETARQAAKRAALLRSGLPSSECDKGSDGSGAAGPLGLVEVWEDAVPPVVPPTHDAVSSRDHAAHDDARTAAGATMAATQSPKRPLASLSANAPNAASAALTPPAHPTFHKPDMRFGPSFSPSVESGRTSARGGVMPLIESVAPLSVKRQPPPPSSPVAMLVTAPGEPVEQGEAAAGDAVFALQDGKSDSADARAEAHAGRPQIDQEIVAVDCSLVRGESSAWPPHGQRSGEGTDPPEGIGATMAPLLASLNMSLSKMKESWMRLNNVTVTHAEALPLSLSLASQLKQPHQHHRSHAAHQSQPPQHLSLYEPVGLQLARAAANPKPHSRTAVAGQQRPRAAVPMGARPHPTKGRALRTLSHGPLASQPFAPKAALGHGHHGRSASRPASAAPADAERRLPRVGSAPASRQGAGAGGMRPVNLAGIGPGRVAMYEL